MQDKIVAIIGRPNVGKSTLFNVFAEDNISIVKDTKGVTRDRIYADCNWRGETFKIIDTGGIEPENEDILLQQMKRQAHLAIDMADVIVFITDVKAGVTDDDKEIANLLRRTKKEVILVCNKSDKVGETPNEVYEFYELGLGDPIAISAGKKLGIGELLDEVYNKLGDFTKEDIDEDVIKVSIIGKPNVGKSSLVNKILKEERVIVADMAGTTRDAIDSYFENEYGKYMFIDTAGIRKKNKVYDAIEKYSVIKAQNAIERSDVSIIMIDATEGVTEQATRISGYAHEAGKGIIICVNKWDLVEKDTGSLEKYKKEVMNKLAYMPYAEILFISAKTGQRTDKLFELVNKVYKANNLRIPTSLLNNVISEAVAITQPPSDKGRRLKVYYATQIRVAPPTFAVFVNSKKLMHFSYLRYLENHIRKNFDLKGTPIRMYVREKKGK